jgi:hypothetical protein
MRLHHRCVTFCCALLFCSCILLAQDGAALFKKNCASNHCSVRLTRSVRRRAASFKSASGKPELPSERTKNFPRTPRPNGKFSPSP